jgi:hypothetical protein
VAVEHCTRIEFAVLLFVEPRALDIEQTQTRHEPGEGQSVDGELGEGLVAGERAWWCGSPATVAARRETFRNEPAPRHGNKPAVNL